MYDDNQWFRDGRINLICDKRLLLFKKEQIPFLMQFKRYENYKITLTDKSAKYGEVDRIRNVLETVESSGKKLKIDVKWNLNKHYDKASIL